MNDDAHPSALVAALQAVSRRRARHETAIDEAIAEVEREDAANRRIIEESHRRLVALRALKQEQEARRSALDARAMAEEAEAVRRGLAEDRERLEARGAQLDEALRARDVALAADLAAPEVNAAIEEYERAVELDASLGAMPAPVRREILERRERLERKLAPWIRAVNAAPPSLGAPPLGIGVLASADPADDAPEALVLLAPVAWATFADWADRRESLATWLAYRLVAAVSRALAAVGAADAPVQYGEVHGCLAIQVWLGDHEVEGDLREVTLEQISLLVDDAPELRAAGLEVYGVWVRPELLVEESA